MLNSLLRSSGFIGNVDLLSIDVDGNDLHFWRAIDVIHPRVVVIEVNSLWGPTRSVTTPYADDFKAEFTSHGSDYAGASLMALVAVGKEKGYRLVGVNAISTNAFFVRNDIQHDWLPEVDAKDCFDHPRAKFSQEKRLPNVVDRDWEEIG